MTTTLPLGITILALAFGLCEAFTIIRVLAVLAKTDIRKSVLIVEAAVAGVTATLSVYVMAMALIGRNP